MPPTPPDEARTAPGPYVPGYVRDHDSHPPLDYPGYGSTALRHPRRPLTPLPHTLTEITAPLLGQDRLGALDHDLTRQHEGEPQGQRVIVHGRVRDSDGLPVPHTLVEVSAPVFTDRVTRAGSGRTGEAADTGPGDGTGRAD
jgi:protocatechuate 3,4-dioxygenase beta subunit